MYQTMTRRGALAGLAGFSGFVLAAPHIARAAPRIIRLGHNNADDSHFGRGSAVFAEAVAADPTIGDVVRIVVHGNAELGDELGMLKSCVKGTLDIALLTNTVVGNVFPLAGLLNAPFMFADVGHARAVLDGPIGREFIQLARANDLNVLAWGENGLRQITANQPIRKPADLRGLKIRVPQSEVMLGGFIALGADAKPLSLVLLREALRTGQFQAQENPIVMIESYKLSELQKYLSLTGHIYDPAIFAASADLIEDLTEAQVTALAACAQQGAAETRRISSQAQQDGIQRLRSAGMTVVDDVDVAAFRAASRPYLESLATKFGPERVQGLISAGT